MKDSADKTSRTRRFKSSHPTRREFLKLSALGAAAAAAAGSPAVAEQLIRLGSQPGTKAPGNTMPGRIYLLRDPGMGGHLSTIDRDLVEENVHLGIRTLTGSQDTAAAFESLFPGLHSGSTFAIKVNCIGPCDTRWEVARGVVSGLSLMLGGTYDVSQVIIYDRHNLTYHGYVESEFTFNGHCPTITGNNGAYQSGYYVWQNHELSQYLLDVDYVINIPALKIHSDGNNQITVALKNHYGSCYPASLCGDIPGMLTLNSDPNVKDKTCLVVTSAIRGTYTGGPGTPAMSWSIFPPDEYPNSLFFTTDPVTNEYWARDIINTQRRVEDRQEKPCPWIEEASGDPYNIGISDPGQMTVIGTLGVDEGPGAVLTGTFLAPNVPNPFSDSTTLRFRLAESGHATLKIIDASGRMVRSLGGREFAGGYSELNWDGRDSRGRKVAPGVYFVRLEAGLKVQTRRIVRVQ